MRKETVSAQHKAALGAALNPLIHSLGFDPSKLDLNALLDAILSVILAFAPKQPTPAAAKKRGK